MEPVVNARLSSFGAELVSRIALPNALAAKNPVTVHTSNIIRNVSVPIQNLRVGECFLQNSLDHLRYQPFLSLFHINGINMLTDG
jgi:hypothetical protein